MRTLLSHLWKKSRMRFMVLDLIKQIIDQEDVCHQLAVWLLFVRTFMVPNILHDLHENAVLVPVDQPWGCGAYQLLVVNSVHYNGQCLLKGDICEAWEIQHQSLEQSVREGGGGHDSHQQGLHRFFMNKRCILQNMAAWNAIYIQVFII